MGRYPHKAQLRTVTRVDKEDVFWFLENNKFGEFNPSILGLGDIRRPADVVEAISCIFDLSSFTDFCCKPDPHLTVPKYLSHFLNWLFVEIGRETIEEELKDGKRLYADLPFLAKFMGDGVLFLWDTSNMEPIDMCNVVATLRDICKHYRDDFYPMIRRKVGDPPAVLRCGIARGQVCSVGDGTDYVGPCINIAARLQKLHGLSFCFHARGLDIDSMVPKRRGEFVTKTAVLRGIGEAELVWVIKEELRALPPEEQSHFGDP